MRFWILCVLGWDTTHLRVKLLGNIMDAHTSVLRVCRRWVSPTHINQSVSRGQESLLAKSIGRLKARTAEFCSWALETIW